ncbi:hypothetical protein [Streptomyces sp. NPDC005303]|uniref:hypothetical protein n=1 Tax=Streptomyces sp. NPDC005303 TaxID=3155713 RepID=UPI0033A2639C
MTDQTDTAVDRIPLARSVHYVARGLPEVPNQYGPGVLAPSEITLTYRAAPDSQLGRVHAYVAGRIWADGKELPLLPGGLYGQHYFDGVDGWPAWLAEEARLHDPDAPAVVPPAESVPSRRAGLRDELAAALYAHDHPGWSIPLREADVEPVYVARAAVVLAVLYREWPWLRAEAEDSAAPSADLTSPPAVWIDGHPQLEAIAAAVWEHCRTEGTSLVVDDPRNIAVAAYAALGIPEDPAAPDLTAQEARDLADELSTELYRAQDALAFVEECCVIADREQKPVTTVDVREWLKGARCGRQLEADARDRAALRDRIAEALYRHNHPGWATRYADLDRDERDTYLGRADAVLAVLPAFAPGGDRG